MITIEVINEHAKNTAFYLQIRQEKEGILLKKFLSKAI
jgi:hypothetical protein